jgi:hypothetical protein
MSQIWAGRRYFLPPRGRDVHVCSSPPRRHRTAEGARGTGVLSKRWLSRWPVDRGLGSAFRKAPVAWQAFPLNGGPPIPVGASFGLTLSWSLDGRSSFISPLFGSQTFIVPPAPGEALPRSQQEDFIPKKKLPTCRECAGSIPRGWYLVRPLMSTPSIAARSGGTSTASRFHDFSRLAENLGAAAQELVSGGTLSCLLNLMWTTFTELRRDGVAGDPGNAAAATFSGQAQAQTTLKPCLFHHDPPTSD